MSVSKSIVVIFEKKVEVNLIRREIDSMRSDILSLKCIYDLPTVNEFNKDQLDDMVKVDIYSDSFAFDIAFYDVDKMNCTSFIEMSIFHSDIFEVFTDNDDLILNKLFDLFNRELSNISLLAFYIDNEILLPEIYAKFGDGKIKETIPYAYREYDHPNSG